MTDVATVARVRLEIAYERSGFSSGWPVVLLHDVPYGPRCHDAVARALAQYGADVIVCSPRSGSSARSTPATANEGAGPHPEPP